MTSFILKIIAMLLMLTDHLGAVLYAVPQLRMQYEDLFNFMRIAGRASFPIFAFLVAQGCTHTKNMQKYFIRMLVFAFISEIPFNIFVNFILGASPSIWNFENQNVFFTWALAVFAVMLYDMAKIADGLFIKVILRTGVVLTALCAILANTDGALGVVLVLMMYIFAPKMDNMDYSKGIPHFKQLIIIAVFAVIYYFPSVSFMTGALVSVFIVKFYNGTRGKKMKWLFYVFYPLHILILTLMGYILKY